MSFESLWYWLVGTILILTIANGILVYRLHVDDPTLLKSLGNPTPFHFAVGGWLTSSRFVTFLLSRASGEAFAHKPFLLYLSRVVAGLFVLMLGFWLAGIYTLLFERIAR
jgi:hypothetical protein